MKHEVVFQASHTWTLYVGRAFMCTNPKPERETPIILIHCFLLLLRELVASLSICNEAVDKTIKKKYTLEVLVVQLAAGGH